MRSALGRGRNPGEGDLPPSPFVVGVGRSGTTLLRLMLDAHQDLAIPPETHFIPQVARECERAADPREAFLAVVSSHRGWEDFHIPEDQFRQRVRAVEPFDLGEVLRTFYTLYAEKMGKPRWGDKTPQYLKSMKHIQDLLPEASFIHLVRDGRDVALSYQKVWFGPDTAEESARWWRSWIEDAREQARDLDRYTEVRYEDLLTNTEPVLREVCRSVGLGWDPAMLDYHLTAEERMREIDRDLPATKMKPDLTGEERMAIHALTSSPPRSDRIGRWKEEMPTADCERFEEIAGATLRESGYETGPSTRA